MSRKRKYRTVVGSTAIGSENQQVSTADRRWRHAYEDSVEATGDYRTRVQVCPQGCGHQPARRDVVARTEWWGRAAVKVLYYFDELNCPHCGSVFVRRCSRCENRILAPGVGPLADRCEWCGLPHPWAEERRDAATRPRSRLWRNSGAAARSSAISIRRLANGSGLFVVDGDVCEFSVDCLVSNDDTAGRMWASVASSIKSAAGSEVERDSVAGGPYPLGSAWATHAGNLPSQVKRIIHVAAMDERGANGGLPSIEACVQSAMEEAGTKGMRSIALAAIGTGPRSIRLSEWLPSISSVILDYLCDSSGDSLAAVFVLYDSEQFDDSVGTLARSVASASLARILEHRLGIPRDITIKNPRISRIFAQWVHAAATIRARWTIAAAPDPHVTALMQDVRRYVLEHLSDNDEPVPGRTWPGVYVLADTAISESPDSRANQGVGRHTLSTGAEAGAEADTTAVFLAYASSRSWALVDKALYFAGDSKTDPGWRMRIGAPEEVKDATRPSLAIDMLDRADRHGELPGCLVADTVYAEDAGLCGWLANHEMPLLVPLYAGTELLGVDHTQFEARGAIEAAPETDWDYGHNDQGDPYEWIAIALAPNDLIPAWNHSLLAVRSASKLSSDKGGALFRYVGPTAPETQQLLTAAVGAQNVSRFLRHGVARRRYRTEEAGGYLRWNRKMTLAMLAAAHDEASRRASEAIGDALKGKRIEDNEVQRALAWSPRRVRRHLAHAGRQNL